MRTIANFGPAGADTGVGLALRGDDGRYLFILAGTRHTCPPGELFYAGIGGHREPGEDWLACAHREALEETGADVELLSAPATWYVPRRGPVQQFNIVDRPRPLAFYEMIYPPESAQAGELYRIVIYAARLAGPPRRLPPDEIAGLIALTPEQVVRGPERKPTLAQLLGEGTRFVAGGESVAPETRLYPLGTARALAHILRSMPPGFWAT